MPKIRINKLALELNVQNDQIIDELHKKNIPVKNYMSSIDEETANYIREVFLPKPVIPKVKAKVKVKAKAKVKAKVKVKAKAQTKKIKIRTVTAKTQAAAAKIKAVTQAAVKKKSAVKAKAKAVKAAVEKGEAAKPAAKVAVKKTAAAKVAPKPAPVKPAKKLGLKIVKKEEKPKQAAKPPERAKKPEKEKIIPLDTKRGAGRAAPAPEKVEPVPKPLEKEEEGFEIVQLRSSTHVRDLAEKLKCSPNDIIKDLMSFGIMATINQSLTYDISSRVADKRGFEVELAAPEKELDFEEEEQDLDKDRTHRPPIVTIMGHVDHGKTSLLDAIRETNLTKHEEGGITQHIGAYQAKIKGSAITFLDTPGHEAFTAMRARGAQVTDIVVLVVAADDGIKPQTKEAIDHANAAAVPIVVAINKIDKPDAKPDEVKKQLADQGLLPEDWGGQTIFTEVSAIQKIGIDDLLEMILLQAEIMDLKANPRLGGKGVIIESKLDRGRGPVATLVVQNGTLKVGDPFIVGCYFGKVRALINDQGAKVAKATPSTPVEVLGLPDVPQPGDKFMVVRDEKKARHLSTLRLQQQRESILAKTSRVTMDDLHKQILEGKIKELNIITKADVQGSIHAVQEAFSKLETAEVRIKIIHEAVGGITESDVLLASASNALIIGFNVRPTEKASQLAARENVDIRLYSIIYDAINDMKKAMEGLLAPKFKEKVIGRAEVRQVFTIPKIGSIAGCQVLSGKLERNLDARLIRDNVVVYQGKILSLRRFKEDVKEVPSGYECGLSLEKYQDLKQGDIVEPFVREEVTP
ncbi:MAG: translation initiation factor IF-2 [Nitrospinaceae bacterium]